MTVRYDRDVDGLFILSGSPRVIVHRTIRRELSIPRLGRFYLAIVASKAVIDNKMTIDNIGILNPLKATIVFANDIEEGIEKYENNF